MTVYTWPDTRAYVPQAATLRIIDNTQRANESGLSGAVQTISMPGARWAWDYDFGAHTNANRAQVEAYLVRLSGREHRVRLWDHKRPRPLGTINTAGVTLGAAAAQFATSLQLAGCGASTTLLAGDWLAVGGQLLMCMANATASGGGAMTVEVRHMLRSAIGSGAAVTLLAPTALYIRADSALAFPRQLGRAQAGFSVAWVESFT